MPLADYEQTYRDFWAPIVQTDGTLDPDKVKRELHDFKLVIDEVPKVYRHITGDRISKPLTEAIHVIEAADEYYANLHDAICDEEDPEFTEADRIENATQIGLLSAIFKYLEKHGHPTLASEQTNAIIQSANRILEVVGR